MTNANQTLELDAADIIEEAPSEALSVRPMVLDAPEAVTIERWAPDDPTLQLRANAGLSRSRVIAGAVSVVALFVILLASVTGAQVRPAASRFDRVGGSRSAPAPAAPFAVIESTPWTAVTQASTPSSWGTITVATGAGSLVVDGALATGATAVVACGTHQIRAGRGRPRNVDVPCGGTVTVDRAGRFHSVAAP